MFICQRVEPTVLAGRTVGLEGAGWVAGGQDQSAPSVAGLGWTPDDKISAPHEEVVRFERAEGRTCQKAVAPPVPVNQRDDQLRSRRQKEMP
ncbi:unnamed protein product [Protopolystoma xenopodis]|uniref:Uncharacterized protein n=1 Tax=Protopolystoma xenopodis TaxID=117903 RepID=A0A448WQJ6_9PLAT|nr:unnamed protein product [Protopolystoma xenopodis]